MRWLFTLVVILVAALPAFADDVVQPPAFSSLKDALVFIDHELDVQDLDGLSRALYPAFIKDEPNRTSWAQLKDERGKLRLADVFSNRNFPDSKDTFVIGASENANAKFIGWSRIRFIKSNNRWYLNAVYGVK